MKTYYVYFVTNYHRTTLYIGVTGNLDRRADEHHTGEGGKFSSQYRTHHLIYFEEFNDVSDAIAREKQLKGWTRAKKEALIAKQNPLWKFLEEQLF